MSDEVNELEKLRPRRIATKYERTKETKKRDVWADLSMIHPTKYERNVCLICRHGSKSAGGNVVACVYILNHSKEHPEAETHRRPCKYYECVKCGVWEPRKRIAQRTADRIREEYKDGTIK